ncbi:MAG: Hpt domain-containing protein [Devosiaceae bacterium]|nr:Hpt domain-containing protein [Devosiaceae bacterium MH13]
MPNALAKGAYETINPPNTLKAKVRILTGREAQTDPVKKAEMAVERLACNFGDWMNEEVERLLERWAAGKSSGFTEENRAALYRAAHDLRGQAATLGYPNVGRIAGTFCDILDELDGQPIPDPFLEKFVNAIRAIARETERNQENETAQALADELAAAAKDLIARQASQASAA